MHTFEELDKESLLVALSKHAEDTTQWLGYISYEKKCELGEIIDLYCHMIKNPYQGYIKNKEA